MKERDIVRELKRHGYILSRSTPHDWVFKKGEDVVQITRNTKQSSHETHWRKILRNIENGKPAGRIGDRK